MMLAYILIILLEFKTLLGIDKTNDRKEGFPIIFIIFYSIKEASNSKFHIPLFICLG